MHRKGSAHSGTSAQDPTPSASTRSSPELPRTDQWEADDEASAHTL